MGDTIRRIILEGRLTVPDLGMADEPRKDTMKIWILTFAHDADEHFVGAFSSEEKAKAASAAFQKQADKLATIWTSIVPTELDSPDLVDIELTGTGD
jgi:hypothetical protein